LEANGNLESSFHLISMFDQHRKLAQELTKISLKSCKNERKMSDVDIADSGSCTNTASFNYIRKGE